MEKIDLPKDYFDGVWAHASLLHVSRENIPLVVDQIMKVLKPSGLLGLTLKEGVGEGFEDYKDRKRWFTYYLDDEIRDLFGEFEVLSFRRNPIGDKYVFLNYILKMKF
ncbi:MAG: class I SAM-dependent methyltransferase [archaeon]|nr:class I SAM-dependent methyltransferase [archaeon]